MSKKLSEVMREWHSCENQRDWLECADRVACLEADIVSRESQVYWHQKEIARLEQERDSLATNNKLLRAENERLEARLARVVEWAERELNPYGFEELHNIALGEEE